MLTFSFAAFSETELILSPDEKLWLAQHPELRLGVIASRLPFEALSSERKQEGIASDRELAKKRSIRWAHPVPDTGCTFRSAKASLMHSSPPSTRRNRVKPCCSPGHTLSCPRVVHDERCAVRQWPPRYEGKRWPP
ncbi:MAG: hypothetical protein ACLR0N_04940 [Bilophila wadsworthia]